MPCAGPPFCFPGRYSTPSVSIIWHPATNSLPPHRSRLPRVLVTTVTIQKSDPDVIVGHEFLGVSLDVLLGRMKDLRADHWSRIGRFRRTRMILGRAGTNLKLLYGRLICDLASDSAKVRALVPFFRPSIVLARSFCGRFSDLDGLVTIMFRKHLGSCASSITRPFSDQDLGFFVLPHSQTRRRARKATPGKPLFLLPQSDECILTRE